MSETSNYHSLQIKLLRVCNLGVKERGSCCSPQWEGPLLVAAQSAAVDGGGARHSVQVVRTVGQRGNPLTVPLRLLFPGDGTRQTCENHR